MKYFVTGATGFVGGRLVRQLREAGHEVVAVVRSLEKAKDLAELGIELHQGDITDKESMREPMKGCDGVFHVAAWYKVGVKDKTMAETINVGGTRNVCELMKELQIPKGVYTSTLAVFSDTDGKLVDESYRHDGDFLSEYDRTKWAAHYEVALPMMEQGLPLVIVQPGLIYGPGDTSSVRDVWIQYLTGKLPLTPKKTAFCWAHVDDIAKAHIQAMEKGKPGESYIIAGPAHTFIEGLEVAEKITGIKPPCMKPGPTTMKAMAGIMRMVGAIVPLPESYNAESLRVVAGVTYIGDNAKAKRELGYDPRPLEEGLRETLIHEAKELGVELPALAEKN